jgi:hypothetical protein
MKNIFRKMKKITIKQLSANGIPAGCNQSPTLWARLLQCLIAYVDFFYSNIKMGLSDP